MVGVLVAAVLSALTFAVSTALGVPLGAGAGLAVVVLIASLPILGSRFGLRGY